MSRHILRFVLILAVGIAAGLVHGLAVDGMKMPPEALVTLPEAPVSHVPDQPVDVAPAEPEDVAVSEAPSADLDPELVKLKSHFDAGTAVLVDARSREDYVAGHIPGAIYGPFEDFIDAIPDWFNALPLDQLVFIYCDGGDCHASEAVASKMKELGMEQVYVFMPGYPAWQAAGFPVTAGEEP